MKYLYQAQVTRVLDGDTFTTDLDLGFGIWSRGAIFRLYGINAPETRVNKTKGITLEDVAKGKETKEVVTKILMNGGSILINSVKDSKEKFGRFLGKVYIPTHAWTGGPYSESDVYIIDDIKHVYLNDHLVHQGYAKAVDYD